MPAPNPGRHTGPSGMTQITVLRRPGDLTVVTGATELALTDLVHGYLIGSNAHLETQLQMTDTTLVANAMEPVRKDNRSYPLAVRTPVEHDISILRITGRDAKQPRQDQAKGPAWRQNPLDRSRKPQHLPQRPGAACPS